jgi:N-acetylneuraminic acid mutarotase/PKD repeat protein
MVHLSDWLCWVIVTYSSTLEYKYRSSGDVNAALWGSNIAKSRLARAAIARVGGFFVKSAKHQKEPNDMRLRPHLLWGLSILTISFALMLASHALATDTTLSWSSTQVLPIEIRNQVTFAKGKSIFLVGGDEPGNFISPQVISAVSRPDGSLTPWSSSSQQLPIALTAAAGAQQGAFAYVLGGKDVSNASSDKVWLGVIDNSGIISSWTQLTSLPNRIEEGKAAISGNWIYFAGGYTEPGTAWNATVYYAAINMDGSIGPWQSAGQLPQATADYGLIAHNNHLIMVGGYTPNGYTGNTYTSAINPDGSVGPWTQTSTLPEPLNASGIVDTGASIISYGGAGPNGPIDRVYYANVNPDGTLSAWQLSGNSLPLPTLHAGGIIANGYAYFEGGRHFITSNDDGEGSLNVYYSKVQSDSAVPTPSPSPLGLQLNPLAGATLNEGGTYIENGSFTATSATSWTATVDYGDGTVLQSLVLSGTSFTLDHTYSNSYFSSGDFAVVVTVTDSQGAVATTTATVKINIPTQINGPWVPNLQLPTHRTSDVAFSYHNNLFIVGGTDESGTILSQVLSAVSNPDGSLSPWSSASQPLPISVFWHAGAQKDNHVYVLGGKSSISSAVDQVYLGTIDNSGLIGSWTQLTPLPKRLELGEAVVSGDRLYFAGGYTEPDNVWNADVYSAIINADGTIGSWEAAGTLPVANTDYALIEHNSHLIEIGGYTTAGYTANAFTTAINPDGTLQGWTVTSPLPQPLNASGIINTGGKVISFGGAGPANPPPMALHQVYSADLNPDGTLGPWLTSPNRLPLATYSLRALLVNGFAYIEGGWNNFRSVYTSAIDPAALVAPNLPPFASANGPYTVTEGGLVVLNATGSDGDGDSLTYAWDLDDSGIFETPGQSVTFSAANLDGPSTYSVTVEATDSAGLTATALATINVLNVSPTVLTPVLVPEPSNEGSAITATAVFSDPGRHDTFICNIDYGDGTGAQAATVSGLTCAGPTHIYGATGNYTVTVSVADHVGAIGSNSVAHIVNNVRPTVGPISAPVDPAQANTAITASASFTDPGTLDTHSAIWDWGDGSTSSGAVQESDGSGIVIGGHIYTAPGVYTLKLTVTDEDGSTGQSVFQYVVVYDPSAGFVTGGGWINSPAAAYVSNTALTGKLNIGFNAKYTNGTTIPTGQTEFDFHAAALDFHSTSYQWLVITSAKAQYEGSGTINGTGNYGFLVTGLDGSLGGGADKVRIKIWDNSTGAVIYDTQMGAADTADPATPLGGGNIAIHN